MVANHYQALSAWAETVNDGMRNTFICACAI